MQPAYCPATDGLFQEKNILCGLKATTRDAAIRELTTHLHGSEGGFALETAIAHVLARERGEPTVLAQGLALPHARLDHLTRMLAAVGLSRDGVDFGLPGGTPVRAILLILTPKSDPGAYLKMLVGLSRLMSQTGMPERLALCATPREACGVLQKLPEHLPPYLSAAHIMDPDPPTVRESDTLGTAIEALCRTTVTDLPVVDEEGDLRGILASEDLLRLSLPEHLLWMEDLSSIRDFQPFADLLRREGETRVADVMRESPIKVAPDTPAIEVARIFLRHPGLRMILVLQGRRFLGTINVHTFVAELFWA